MNVRFSILLLACLAHSDLAARSPRLLFNDSTLQSVRKLYNNPSPSFPFGALRQSIVERGSLTGMPNATALRSVYDEEKAILAKLLAFRYCVEADADGALGDRAFYWLSTKYVEDKYVYEADDWSEWIENALALSHYCIAFDMLCGAGYFELYRHPEQSLDQAYWDGLKQATAQRLRDKAAAIYGRVKNFRTVGDAAAALLFGNQTVLNEAKFRAQLGNHRIIVASGLGVAAYLLADFGFAAEAQLWLTFAQNDVEHFLLNKKLYPPLGSPAVTVESQNADGAFPEGIEYLNYSGRAFIPFMIATRLNTGKDHFRDPELKKLMDWCYDLQLPDGSAPQINSTGYNAYPINALTAAVIPGGRKYLGQLTRFAAGTGQPVDIPVEAFALLDSTTVAEPVLFASITNLAAQGELVMRNDAREPTRYVLITAKHARARYAAELHGYADAGSFLFHADGRTLVRHPGYAGYADSRELERARSHNTVCPIVLDTVNDDAPNRDIASPPAADAWITNSSHTPDFSFAAVTMELYGSKRVNASDQALALYFAAGNLPYDYGNSLHATWKDHGEKFGIVDRKFLLVNNAYLVVRDDVRRTNARLQYAVSYVHGNNGNNPTHSAALSNGLVSERNGEQRWNAGGSGPVLRVNTTALGGTIAGHSALEAGVHQAPDDLIAPGAPRATYFHAALKTACGFADNYGQMLTILEADPSLPEQHAETVRRNGDADPYVLYTIDGRRKKYGRYDVIFSQKESKTVVITNTGLPFPIETDASFMAVSYAAEPHDTNGMRLFSNRASFIRWGEHFFVPNDTGDAQTSFTLRGPATQVSQSGAVPAAYTLDQNFPNPFNPSTTIRFTLPEESRVNVQVIDVLGRVVAVLAEGVLTSGWKTVEWNARAASGMYLCRMEAASTTDPARRFTHMRKMMLMK